MCTDWQTCRTGHWDGLYDGLSWSCSWHMDPLKVWVAFKQRYLTTPAGRLSLQIWQRRSFWPAAYCMACAGRWWPQALRFARAEAALRE